MYFRKGIAMVTLLMMCIILVSCANGQTPKGSSDTTAPTTSTGSALDFRITWKGYSGRGATIQAIVDAYNKKYCNGEKILLINGDEDRTAIENLLESNTKTVFVLPYRYVKYFGDKGYLTDMTKEFKDEKALFYPKVWSMGTVDDATYGIPWLGHSMCLLYNKTLLEESGVKVESINSLDGLIDAMDVIEAKTGAKGIGLVGADSNDLSWMVNQFIYGFGSSLVSADGKSVTINNQKSKAAINMYKNTLGSHAQPTWVNDTAMEVMTYFRNQEVAFEVLGIWGVTDIAKNGSPFEVGIISLNDIGLCSEVGPMMLSIPSGMSKTDKEEAIHFMKYMISKEAQEEIMKGEYSPEHDTYYPFRTPIRFDMADSQIFQSHPEYQTFVEGFQNPSIDVPVPEWQVVKDQVYSPGLHQVMTGEMSIEMFLQTVESKGNKILNTQ